MEVLHWAEAWGDHPRVCGKDNTTVNNAQRSYGITPAYAGKTSFKFVSALFARDHPRVCGKDVVELVRLLMAQGSPPRMRERR